MKTNSLRSATGFVTCICLLPIIQHVLGADEPDKPEVLARLRHVVAEREKKLQAGYVERRIIDKTWRGGMLFLEDRPPGIDMTDEEYRKFRKAKLSEGLRLWKTHERIYFAPGKYRDESIQETGLEGPPSEAQRPERKCLKTAEMYAEWAADSERLDIYAPSTPRYRPDKYPLAAIGKPFIGEIDRVTLEDAEFRGKPCYRIAEPLPKAAVRYVQLVDPQNGLLLYREKHYINATRKKPLNENEPFWTETYEWQRDEKRDVWVPARLVERLYDVGALGEKKERVLLSETTVEFVQVSLESPPAEAFGIPALNIPVRHAICDNREAGGGARPSDHNSR